MRDVEGYILQHYDQPTGGQRVQILCPDQVITAVYYPNARLGNSLQLDLFQHIQAQLASSSSHRVQLQQTCLATRHVVPTHRRLLYPLLARFVVFTLADHALATGYYKLADTAIHLLSQSNNRLAVWTVFLGLLVQELGIWAPTIIYNDDSWLFYHALQVSPLHAMDCLQAAQNWRLMQEHLLQFIAEHTGIAWPKTALDMRYLLEL